MGVFRSQSEPIGFRRISHARAPVGAALVLPLRLWRTLVTAAGRGRSSSHYHCRETGSAKVFTHASTCTRWLVQTPLFFKYWPARLAHAQARISKWKKKGWSHVTPTLSLGASLGSCSRQQRFPFGPLTLEAVLSSCISLNVFIVFTKEQFTTDKLSKTLRCKCKDRERF